MNKYLITLVKKYLPIEEEDSGKDEIVLISAENTMAFSNYFPNSTNSRKINEGDLLLFHYEMSLVINNIIEDKHLYTADELDAREYHTLRQLLADIEYSIKIYRNNKANYDLLYKVKA